MMTCGCSLGRNLLPCRGRGPIPDDFVTVRTLDKGHGRLDERVLTISSLLADYQPWPYLAQAVQVVRTSRRGRRKTREVRDGITSVPATVASTSQVLSWVRDHWQIENGLHYRRDVTLTEDASLVRRGHATLNNFVCSITAQAGIANLAALSARWQQRLIAGYSGTDCALALKDSTSTTVHWLICSL